MSDVLTRREREVMECVRQGMTNAEIGARLFISIRTVQTHIMHVMNKLHAKSRYKALLAMDELGPPRNSRRQRNGQR